MVKPRLTYAWLIHERDEAIAERDFILKFPHNLGDALLRADALAIAIRLRLCAPWRLSPRGSQTPLEERSRAAAIGLFERQRPRAGWTGARRLSGPPGDDEAASALELIPGLNFAALDRRLPFDEFYCISEACAAAIEAAKARSGRVIAMKTSAVRALESANANGPVRAGEAERADASLMARRPVLWMRSISSH